jgi:uncharacterized membrane protein
VKRIARIVQIGASVRDVYEAWRRVEDFPRFLHYVKTVDRDGRGQTSWEASLIPGKRLRWQACVTEDVPNTRIRWQSTSGVKLQGLTEFIPAEGGCVVLVVFEFEPPLGILGEVGSVLLDVEARLEDELERIKLRVEGGAVAKALAGARRGRREKAKEALAGITN